MSTHLVILGALGRLGRAIFEEAERESDLKVVGVVEPRERQTEARSVYGSLTLAPHLKDLQGNIDVVVDATLAREVPTNLEAAVARSLAYVLPVTGLSEVEKSAVAQAAKTIPIVVAPNLSLGVTVLRQLVSQASRLFHDAHIEILESHHQHKKDAPSGTAIALAETIAEAHPERPDMAIASLPKGAPRNKHVIVHSLRGGDIVGDHRVQFLGDGERIEISHTATSRRIFARGALRAMKFVAGKAPGIYSMADVLGIRSKG